MINPDPTDMIEVVKYFISFLKPDVYLELGIYKGETISYARKFANRCIGVDIILPDVLDGDEFYQMTTDEFFKTVEIPQIDIAFIDADHSYKQVLKDFDNVFQYLSPQGIIFLHDTFPKSQEYTSKGFCGDAYKITEILNKRDDCQIVTLPVHPGLSIVRKQGGGKPWEVG